MYCRFCGARLPEEAEFCVKCGRNLSVNQSIPTAGGEVEAQSQFGTAGDNVQIAVQSPLTVNNAGSFSGDKNGDRSTSLTVLGLPEDDSCLLLQTLCEAWNLQASIKDNVSKVREDQRVLKRDRKRLLVCAVAAPVVLLLGLVCLFAVLRWGLTIHLIAPLVFEIVAASAMVIGVVLLIKIRKADASGSVSDSYIKHCEDLKKRIQTIVTPIEVQIPEVYRTQAFAQSVLHDIHSAHINFDAAVDRYDSEHVFKDGNRLSDCGVSRALIESVRKDLSGIDSIHPSWKFASSGGKKIMWTLVPLLSPIIGAALAVVLCVTVVNNSRIYLGGHDQYPSFGIQNILTTTYRHCSQYGEYSPADSIQIASSSLAYRPKRQAILATFDVPYENADNTEKNGNLASCLYRELGGAASVGSSEALDFFNRLALDGMEIRSDGVNVSMKRGRSCYIADKKVTIAGYSMGLTGVLTVTIGLGARTPSPDLSKFDEDINDKLQIASLSELDKSLPSLGDIAAKTKGDDGGQSSKQSAVSNNDAGTSNDNQGTSSAPSESSTDTDFVNLWHSVVDGQSVIPLVGTYCRQDGVCISLNANPSYTPGTYGDEYPGSLAFASGIASPLPGGASRSDLGFQYQSQPALPSVRTPISLMAGCQGSAGCDDGSQTFVYFVMAGTGLDAVGQFSIPVAPGNPPDSSRDYLVMGTSASGPTIADSTVFYRQE